MTGYEALRAHLHFDRKGRIPALIVDDASGRALTLCFLNATALRRTLETRLVHVFRRSKNRVALKGELSGHTQQLRAIFVDCEGKSLLLRVHCQGGACHMGYASCFYRRWDEQGESFAVTEAPVFDPAQVYPGAASP